MAYPRRCRGCRTIGQKLPDARGAQVDTWSARETFTQCTQRRNPQTVELNLMQGQHIRRSRKPGGARECRGAYGGVDSRLAQHLHKHGYMSLPCSDHADLCKTSPSAPSPTPTTQN